MTTAMMAAIDGFFDLMHVDATVALWAGGPVYLCSSAAVASLPAQAGSSVVYTAAGFEGPTASLPAKQGNITKSNKLKQQEVSRTACSKIRPVGSCFMKEWLGRR